MFQGCGNVKIIPLQEIKTTYNMGKPMDTNQPIFMWTGPGRLANDADIELSGTDPLTGKAMSYIARVKSIGQDDDMGGGKIRAIS